MTEPPDFDPPIVIDLGKGFCDPELAHPSQLAIFWMPDGTRVEFAVRDAVAVHACIGPRVETHRLLVSQPTSGRQRSVAIIQLRELAELNGMPEILRALELFEAGLLKDAARYAAAAGPRWSGLVDFFGGPA